MQITLRKILVKLFQYIFYSLNLTPLFIITYSSWSKVVSLHEILLNFDTY
jgi:hypothetical protein